MDSELLCPEIALKSFVIKQLSQEPIKTLEKKLQRGEPDTRIAIIQALEINKSEAAIDLILAVLMNDEDGGVKLYAASALGHLGATKAIPALTERLNDEDPYVAIFSARALGKLGAKEEAVSALSKKLNSEEDPSVVLLSARALGELGAKEKAVSALTERLNDDNPEIVACAVSALEELGATETMEEALTRLKNRAVCVQNDVLVKWAAEEALENIKKKKT